MQPLAAASCLLMTAAAPCRCPWCLNAASSFLMLPLAAVLDQPGSRVFDVDPTATLLLLPLLLSSRPAFVLPGS